MEPIEESSIASSRCAAVDEGGSSDAESQTAETDSSCDSYKTNSEVGDTAEDEEANSETITASSDLLDDMDCECAIGKLLFGQLLGSLSHIKKKKKIDAYAGIKSSHLPTFSHRSIFQNRISKYRMRKTMRWKLMMTKTWMPHIPLFLDLVED